MLRPLGSDAFWGGAALRVGAPPCETHRNILYLPQRGGPGWGLYDREGRMLNAALDRWGVEGRLMNQSAEPVAPPPGAARSDASFLYIGRAQLHFGHFLIETLARCWPLAGRPIAPETRLLVHGADLQTAWEGYRGHAFVAEIFALLGFTPDRLIHFDAPTWIGEVRVPEPAVQQQAFAYEAQRELCLHIGRQALRAVSPTPTLFERLRRLSPRRSVVDRPIWLSRSQLYSASMRVLNEPELDAALRERGWEVIHPEQLALAEQIRLFHTRDVICGLAGSAFHTAIFAQHRGRWIVLSVDDQVNSNFHLFDLLIGRPSEYYRIDNVTLVEDLGPDHVGTDAQRFARTYAFDDPVALADALTRLIRA